MHDADFPMPDPLPASEGAVAATCAVIQALLQDELGQKEWQHEDSLTNPHKVSASLLKNLPMTFPARLTRKVGTHWLLLLDWFEETILWDDDRAAENHYFVFATGEVKPTLGHDGNSSLSAPIPKEPNKDELARLHEDAPRCFLVSRRSISLITRRRTSFVTRRVYA